VLMKAMTRRGEKRLQSSVHAPEQRSSVRSTPRASTSRASTQKHIQDSFCRRLPSDASAGLPMQRHLHVPDGRLDQRNGSGCRTAQDSLSDLCDFVAMSPMPKTERHEDHVFAKREVSEFKKTKAGLSARRRTTKHTGMRDSQQEYSDTLPKSRNPRSMLAPGPAALVGQKPDGDYSGCRTAQDALSELCNFVAISPMPKTKRHEDHAAEEREAPGLWRTAQERRRDVRGRLILKASADHKNAVRAKCSITSGVLTVSIANTGDVVAKVPVEELVVGLRRGHSEMFTVATLHKNARYDEISCFAVDQVKRDKWIAVFRRMGVPVFDASEA